MSSTPTPMRLSLELASGADDALLRVVSALHRRRAKVISLAFAGARVELLVDPPAARAHCLGPWLRAIVGVQDVRQEAQVAAAV